MYNIHDIPLNTMAEAKFTDVQPAIQEFLERPEVPEEVKQRLQKASQLALGEESDGARGQIVTLLRVAGGLCFKKDEELALAIGKVRERVDWSTEAYETAHGVGSETEEEFLDTVREHGWSV